jgi:mono/diheme cytochrome c family protein
MTMYSAKTKLRDTLRTIGAMTRVRRYTVAGLVAVTLFTVGAAVARFTVSALPEPGRTETLVATEAKRLLIHNGSRRGIPPAPPNRQSAIQEGIKLYRKECASCHGARGYDLTDAGRWMYPRAADLVSRDSQSYSDQEVFWIIKNGVRLSGMPAFGKVESDDHIWDLVFYFRTLPKKVPHTQIAQSRYVEGPS